MVAVKGKLNAAPSRVTGDKKNRKSVGLSFKVYSENERVNVGSRDSVGTSSTRTMRETLIPTRRKSVQFNKGTVQSNSSDSKGNLKGFEKDKDKRNSSLKTVVRRKALADVSNVQGNCSTTIMRDGSKSVVTQGQGTITVCASSRKPSMGKMGTNISQGIGVCNTSKRASAKNLKASSNKQMTKDKGRESVNNAQRTARLSYVLTRKSLPVIRRVNKVDRSDLKENVETSEQGKGKSSFLVKTKAGEKVIPQVRNTRTNLLRNRASDGFILLASRRQTNVDAHAIPKRPIRPTLRTTVKTSKVQTQRTLKSKRTSVLDKSISGAAISSKNKEKLVPSSLPESIGFVGPHQPAQGELPPDGNASTSTNTSDINNRRKSDRRRSFTLSLMTRSKQLEEHGEFRKLEKLPSIDDNCNHLEVAEYVEEIYQYYWVTELQAQNPSMQNYMSIQSDITPQMRGILINWLIEVHFKFELMQETLYLMVTLFDRYLSLVPIKKNDMQLVGLTALLLASKYEDFWHPRVKDLISISAESYTRDQMLGMVDSGLSVLLSWTKAMCHLLFSGEKVVLNKLKFRLNVPTPYVFMMRFLKAAQSDKRLEHLAFYLIELCLVEYEALKYKPSLLCASAIYLARDCAEMILKFQKAARTGQLKVTYEKYVRPDQSGVAAITPLNRLPL
ncbi:putative cyclin-B3-1 [Vitis vinifera]|uniref:Putative cyclin-B3-1 n=1 Tax=Vitis vinifera TaxID=29760 RepID=A0A438IB11_VITVI|nr:putative cyclin-B3-1 [Vitis vinifera]